MHNASLLPSVRFLVRVFLAVAFTLTAGAQQPDTLRHSLDDPGTALQGGARQGYSVAVDGGLTVVGAPFDKVGGNESGRVKVYDTATGALLHVLVNPSPAASDRFGWSVAVSGTRVVVGAYGDDTGAFNAGSAYVYDLASATPTVPVATLNNPSPADSDNFGWSVAVSSAQVVVGAYRDDAGATDAGSAYVYDLASATPTVPVATLNNPSPAMQDYFGNSVAVSGTRVVVGAYLDDTGVANAGSAYVYDLASATPTVPVYSLNKTNNTFLVAGAQFGASVAISGTRVVVGAPGIGAAFPYTLDFLPTTPVFPLSPGGNDFGVSVAISGSRIVVGASLADTGATDAGSAYVYDISSFSNVPIATLSNPGPAVRDSFGISVAISGTWVVVGAFEDDTGATDAGSAYVYDLASATPTVPVATLNNPGPALGDLFGISVAVSGTRVVVGAPLDNTGATAAGRAYVYDLASATPTVPVTSLNNPSPTTSDNFGWSVAVSGTRVVVGAYGEDAGATNAGRAYVYDLASATPTVPVATLNNPSPGPVDSDNFGWSVAVSGTRVVVGAYQDDTGATDAGRAYVYDLASATPTVPVATLNNPGPASGDNFGISVAVSGTRVVVGAYRDVTGASDAGSTYVYDLASATPTVPVATLNNPSPASGDLFGWSVAVSGTRVVVGANRDDTGTSDAGSAYVYDLAGPTPTVPVATLNNPGPAFSDNFGISVAVSGTRVVVGAYADDAGATNAGSAYVYDLAGATPTVPVASLSNPSPASSDYFGNSVAIDGTTAAIGTPYEDGTTVDRGAAYIFAPANPDFDADGLLDIWEYARFGTTAGHSALDDADADGRKELLELAFDTDPTRPDTSAVFAPVRENGFLTITIARRAGVTYTVQTSATPNTEGFSAATTTVLINTASTLKVRDNFPTSTTAQRYLRVLVTAAP